MDPFVVLARSYVDNDCDLGHSALPGAPQRPLDRRPSRPRRRTLWLQPWRRRLGSLRRRQRSGTPTPVRSPCSGARRVIPDG